MKTKAHISARLQRTSFSKIKIIIFVKKKSSRLILRLKRISMKWKKKSQEQ